MLVHLDTSVMIDAFTGPRHSLRHVAAATRAGHVLAYSALVQYEWLRGPRTSAEVEAVREFFGEHGVVPFGEREAGTAASLYRAVKRPRQRQADLAIAACALEHGAQLWSLNSGDFTDVPGLRLYRTST
jgi:predicted nucleic acid-binding protein